jgi:hypothetical protein
MKQTPDEVFVYRMNVKLLRAVKRYCTQRKIDPYQLASEAGVNKRAMTRLLNLKGPLYLTTYLLLTHKLGIDPVKLMRSIERPLLRTRK